ncbi:glutathione S-transferase N-terminal domain-containing protein [Yoonia sp. SDW83-1]|uniref:glutathione S-transferase N-terminal domain-containing protein n=1 Tax=Yoonia sp. SDW83-1 TaxID=3366945 RepID=UPI00398C5618
MFKFESKTYLAINPRGTVPTLKQGDVTVGQSIAILAWLDRQPITPAEAQEGFYTNMNAVDEVA